MKVLLLSPPTISIVNAVVGSGGPPIGLAYLASVAREEGHKVKILDCPNQKLSFEDLRREISSFSPDVVGITSTTSTIKDAYVVAKITKEWNENAKVVIGGPHVSFVPKLTFEECPYVDYLVMFEGEETWRELLDKVERGKQVNDVRGLAYKEGDAVKINPPRAMVKSLDELPLPAYDLLPWKAYELEGKKFATIITSRGCPFNCIFCSSSLQFGKVWRGHSPERVLEELKILREEHGREEIEFLDDTFTLNRKRAIEIAKNIKREGLDISWSFSSRVDTIDLELAKELRSAGGHAVFFGLESGSQRILDLIGKGISLERAKRAVKIAKEAELNVMGAFIIGFPDETPEEMIQTINFSLKLDLDFVQYTIATPYPGTKLWEIALKEDLLLTRDWSKFTTVDVVMKNKYLSPKEIMRMFQKAYVKFYGRLSYLMRDIFRRKGFIFKRAIKAFVRYLFSGDLRPSHYGNANKRFENEI